MLSVERGDVPVALSIASIRRDMNNKYEWVAECCLGSSGA